MRLKLKIPTILGIFAALICLACSTPVASNEPKFQASLGNFSKNIFGELMKSKGETSIIYSPFSIQTCLTMVRMGADGETALEMDEVLGFNGQSAESVADNYHSLLAKYEQSHLLKIANKFYVMKGVAVQDKYKEIMSGKFLSSAENIDFVQSKEAAATINSWVETKTDKSIKDFINPDTLSDDTRLLLITAIHFKGKWSQAFDAKLTHVRDFYIDETETTKLPIMQRLLRNTDWAMFRELNASAVRLRYANSDLSMMIVLPNARSGLTSLKEKLKDIPLSSLTTRFVSHEEIVVHLPKFKTEFDLDLSDTLQRMGMKKIFGEADLNKMLKYPESFRVSNVMHKAVIEVNEDGTAASAATGALHAYHSAPPQFIANHPFYYVIMNEDSVPLFQGTFVGI